MRTSEDYQTLSAMRRFGGGFVNRLAEAGFAADDENLTRLKTAWPEYWETYRKMGEEAEARERTREKEILEHRASLKDPPPAPLPVCDPHKVLDCRACYPHGASYQRPPARCKAHGVEGCKECWGEQGGVGGTGGMGGTP